jgi:hypothetical protein
MAKKMHLKILSISGLKGNANQNHVESTLLLLECYYQEHKQQGWLGCGEKRTLTHYWWKCK